MEYSYTYVDTSEIAARIMLALIMYPIIYRLIGSIFNLLELLIRRKKE